MHSTPPLALACPACGSGLALEPARSWRCARCGGRLLPDAPEIARCARPDADGVAGPCPSCELPLSPHRLDGHALGRCAACGLWWIPGQPEEVAPHRRGRWRLPVGAALATAATLATVGAGWTVPGRRAPVAASPAPRPPVSATPPAPATAAPIAPTTMPPPAHLPPAPEQPIPPDHLFAGRSADWWEHRLSALAARTDDEGRRLHAATVSRAEALGLVVRVADGVSHVRAGEALARVLREEAKSPPGAPNPEPRTGARP